MGEVSLGRGAVHASGLERAVPDSEHVGLSHGLNAAHSECVMREPAWGSCSLRFRPVLSCSSLLLSDSSAVVYRGSAAA